MPPPPSTSAEAPLGDRGAPGGIRSACRSILWMAAVLAALGTGCSNGDASGGAGAAEGEATSAATADTDATRDERDNAASPSVEVVASGLEVPWDLAFAPDGRIFVTERPGRVRVIEDGALRAEPWAELDVAAVGEAGLTAIALDPEFPEDPYVYVLGTFRVDGGLVNRVVRLTERGGLGEGATVLIDDLPSDRFHAGGALDFGPDGALYLTTGDATQPPLAQDPSSLAGKLLRYRADGRPTSGNPYPGPVVAIGLRNVQGIDWEPEGEALFASEHGPSGLPNEGGREGHDEVNHLVEGGNYGWPEVAGRGGGQRFVQPLAVWTPAIAPSGLAVYSGDAIPAWRGNAFIGALRGRHLRRLDLERDGDGWRIATQEALFDGDLGRIRGVVDGPDGHLWITTSNRDGRGDPAADDDRILRVVPGG